MDIGADLRKARLAKKGSIEDVSRSTKISSSVLRAIENDDFAKVPGGLFTRGYLRAYARDVGLDPEEIVERFRAEYETPAPTADAERPTTQAPAASASWIPDSADEDTRARRTQLVELGIILIVVGACFAFLRLSPSSPVAPPRAEASAQSPARSEQPVATTGRSAPAGRDLNVEVRATGPCWVEATADGKRVVAQLMNAGDHQVFTMRDDLKIRVGDPGAFAFSIDGVPGRAIGRAGQPAWIRIDRQNYKTWLERRQ